MKKIFFLALTAAALSGGIVWQYMKNNSKDHQDTLILYGNVDTHKADLAFRVPGRVQKLFVNEGDSIKAGQLLAQLDSKPAEDDLNMASAELAVQKATLEKLLKGARQEEIYQARNLVLERQTTVRNLEGNASKLEKLYAGGGAAKQTVEDMHARLKEARARCNLAENQLALLENGAREEDISIQKAVVTAAEARVSKAQTAVSDTVLSAFEDGVILTKVREQGSIVQAGQTIYSVALIDPVYIRAYVSQTKMGWVKPGAKVAIRIDSMPNRIFEGVVAFVSAAAEFTPKNVETQEVRNDLVFRIRILAQDPDNILRQGMPVTIEIAR